jgi:acyl-coenzyme A thioesterase PaaI-like protein
MIEEQNREKAFSVVKTTPYLQHLGIELVEFSENSATMKMPMKQELRQPYLTVHYLRPVVNETTICVAKTVRVGRRLITVSADVSDETGRLIATAISTYSKV